MKKLHIIILLIGCMLSVVSTGCIEDDFTTSSTDLLEFSCDTLAFDTVFTQEGTPTKKFTVYNRHSKMINISSIKLAGTSGGHFYMNVDGVTGMEFNNVEIRGKDSIFIFVEAKIDVTNQDNPIAIEDNIEFVTNNVTQKVLVTAWGQDVVRKYGDIIESDTRLTANKPYVIFDSLVVNEGATLTLEPGTTLCFHDKAFMRVDGKLIAKGTQDKPITLRGDRMDHVVGKIGYDIMAGQWGGVELTENSYENEMEYVSMRGSSWGVYADSANVERRKLHLFNSVLHNSQTSVLTSRYSWIDAEGTEFSDAGASVVSLEGGKYNFVQCTFANYYLFGAVTGALISLDYVLPEHANGLPLMDAKFDNSILYGNAADVNIGDLTGSNVYFRYCLLKSKGSDDSNFINCKWGGDPRYYTVREDYVFDYRLKNKSDAIAIGNREFCPQSARYDRYGVDRFMRDGIDIGAYTWVDNPDSEKDKK